MIRPAALSMHKPLAGAMARIFAFPHAGGGASAFMKLRAALGKHRIELCPLQPPGRENRSAEPPQAVIEDVACEFAAAIETLESLPSTFLGHSMGGLTAYLTACRLEGKAAAPHHLVVSASLSPSLRHAPDTQSPQKSLRDRILSFGGIPNVILANSELFDMYEELIRADIAMIDAYRHVPVAPLTCGITVYSGTGDHAALPTFAPAWQALTVHKLRMRDFEGGHFFLYAEPEKIAAALYDDLYRTLESARPDYGGYYRPDVSRSRFD